MHGLEFQIRIQMHKQNYYPVMNTNKGLGMEDGLLCGVYYVMQGHAMQLPTRQTKN